MESVCPKEKCTGCTACMNVCAHHAIHMQPDLCGFMHPVIHQNLCVDCGLCVKTCPVNNPLPLEQIKECYAVTVKDEKELLSCSSGGAATALSKYVISYGGVVYGCSGTNPRHVRHIRVDDLNVIYILKGSKYVHSDLGESFTQIKADLEHFPLVLFIGTPCQVAGLKNYLHKDYSNLITIDLVCHGVPSQKMLSENLGYYCTDNKEVEISFRRKNTNIKSPKIQFGWLIRNKHTNKETFKPYNKDYYMFGFMRCLTFRENCYSCPYAQNHRVGDLTICDFWGLQPDAGFSISKGVSAVLVNTEKGKKLFHSLKNEITWKRREVLEVTRWNDQLNHPCKKPNNYDYFIRSYSKSSFRKAMIKAYYGKYISDYYIHYKNLLKLFLFEHKLLHIL
jgi:coenzyme F420-reducing hydrogenase beta subunit